MERAFQGEWFPIDVQEYIRIDVCKHNFLRLTIYNYSQQHQCSDSRRYASDIQRT